MISLTTQSQYCQTCHTIKLLYPYCTYEKQMKTKWMKTNTKKTILNEYLVGWVSSPDILTYRISPQPEKNAISCSAESCIEI